jgi:hypothetical protein
MAKPNNLNVSPGGGGGSGGGAKGGASSFGGSPQFSEGVTVGPKGSFGPYSPPRPAGRPSSFDAEPTFVNRWNPVTQSPKQAAYVNARQGQPPARGEEVTIKGVNDGLFGKKVVARGLDNTGASVRVRPADSPTQAAYSNARWANETPARNKFLPGITDGWGTPNASVRGFDK